MGKLKKEFWMIFILYYIVSILTIVTTQLDFQAVVRELLGALLFYLIYIGKNWARILLLVLLWIAVIMSSVGVLFSLLVRFNEMWLFILMIFIYGYIIYTLQSKKVKLVFKYKQIT